MLLRLGSNLARFVLSLCVATIAVFAMMRVLPGDPAVIAAGENASPQIVASLAHQFGTDRPLVVQYWDWFSGLWRGDFGISYVTRTDISPLVADKVQVSLILVTLAMALALAIAIPAGTIAAVRHNKPSGTLISALSQLGIAIPGFLLGIVLVSFFALRLGWLPANGWVAPVEGFSSFLSRLVLPVMALAGVQSAILVRYVRSAVLGIMHEDYLRTARAKGLSPLRALAKHGLRNAAIPVLTVTSVQFSALIIGAVVIERVFVIPGLGSMLLAAVGNRDLLTVQSVVMVLVAITLIVNLLVDMLYTILDPRIRAA
ncbi:MAG: ABC transporter permease [Paeniglutamicibacter terrestris]|uniref:ABC transporter permease n=1 Tax=Paeniglutamicibacter terrestris TaxID=2723403 RepID=A0ABX1G6Y4_9MICC|nr:ABC transporter permease [Paeniglutamicibacter terrestris]ASN40330.1 ABC transporter permease [Arthrobacter sp. 7749]NKG21326.1 ABC transporter permease [Paeniglutamicibacter terrestris]